MNFWAIGVMIVAIIGFVAKDIMLRSAEQTIKEYETLIWVQDEIITEYRRQFGDIKVDLSKGE